MLLPMRTFNSIPASVGPGSCNRSDWQLAGRAAELEEQGGAPSSPGLLRQRRLKDRRWAGGSLGRLAGRICPLLYVSLFFSCRRYLYGLCRRRPWDVV